MRRKKITFTLGDQVGELLRLKLSANSDGTLSFVNGSWRVLTPAQRETLRKNR